MGRRIELPLFAGVTAFLALLQVFGLWSGACRVPFGHFTAFVAVGAAAALAVAFASRFSAGSAAPAATAPVPWRWMVRAAAAAAGGWAVLVWARLWLLAWRRPPFDWDGLYYHIPAIHEWVRAGRVCWLDTPPEIPFVNYPMGVEATTFFLHALHGATPLVNAANLWYWPLGVLALVAIARRLGAGDAWAWLGGALLAVSPVMVSQSVTCYTDVGHAATALAALAASLLLVFPLGGARAWRAVLWGAALGLMAGAKGSGLPGAVIVAAGVVVAVLLRHRDGWRGWWPHLLLGLAVAAAVGGYWYLRNVVETGNPVHPIQVAIGRKVIFPGYDHVQFSEANLPAWLAAYPPRLRMLVAWLQTDSPIQGSAPVGGLGYLWPFAGLPCAFILGVLLWRRRRTDAAAGPFLLLAGMVLVMLATQTSAWWSRFTLYVVGLGLPSLVVVLQRAQAATRLAALRLLIVLAAAAAVGVGVWESGRTLRLEEADGRRVDAAGRVSYPTSLQRIAGGLDALPGLDRFLAATHIGRTRWGRLGTLMGGVLAQPLGRRDIRVLPPAPTPADVAALRDVGAAWLLWDEEAAGALPPELRGLFVEELVYRPQGPGFLFLRFPSAED